MATYTDQALSEHGVKAALMKAHDQQSVYYPELSTRVESNTREEHYRWLGALPQVREMVDGRRIQGVYNESYDVVNKVYELTTQWDRDAVSDDQTGQIMLRIAEMGARAAVHKDRLIANLLMNGADAAALAYDGKSFFADDHESHDSGVQSNKLTYNASDHTAVTVAEMQDAFDIASGKLLSFKDDKGEPLALTDRGLYVVCHPSVKIRWLTALNAAFVGSTANVRDALGVKTIGMPWFTDTAKWWLLKCDEPVRPFIFQDREPIEVKLISPFNEGAQWMSDSWIAGVRARYAMAYGRWEYAVETTFN